MSGFIIHCDNDNKKEVLQRVENLLNYNGIEFSKFDSAVDAYYIEGIKSCLKEFYENVNDSYLKGFKNVILKSQNDKFYRKVSDYILSSNENSVSYKTIREITIENIYREYFEKTLTAEYLKNYPVLYDGTIRSFNELEELDQEIILRDIINYKTCTKGGHISRVEIVSDDFGLGIKIEP